MTWVSALPCTSLALLWPGDEHLHCGDCRGSLGLATLASQVNKEIAYACRAASSPLTPHWLPRQRPIQACPSCRELLWTMARSTGPFGTATAASIWGCSCSSCSQPPAWGCGREAWQSNIRGSGEHAVHEVQISLSGLQWCQQSCMEGCRGPCISGLGGCERQCRHAWAAALPCCY